MVACISPNQACARRRSRALVGLVMSAAVGVQCRTAPPSTAHGLATDVAILPVTALASSGLTPETGGDLERLVREQPLRFLHECLDHYRETVQDYRCTFIKQERIGTRLTPEQVIDVRFREQPTFSVNMKWTRNADGALQALYVKDRWVDGQGAQQAYVKPAGIISFMKLKQPIHGALAQKASRRFIDEFGFGNTLELIVLYSDRAEAAGQLDLRYAGDAIIDGRPAYAFERRLPYAREGGNYPDALAKICIDKEWLVPTAVYSYADAAGQELLGKYVHEDLAINAGLPDSDFELTSLDQ